MAVGLLTMDRRIMLASAAALLPASLVRDAQADGIPNAAQQAFNRLALLKGEWMSRYADGYVHRVTYRLTAGGTVLTETWTMSATRESMTVYFVEGDALIAVHYCPQGTQPRLKLAELAADGTMVFRLDGGSNLAVPDRSHQNRFAIQVVGDAAFKRSEHYMKNGEAEAAGKADDELVSYVRMPSETQEIF